MTATTTDPGVVLFAALDDGRYAAVAIDNEETTDERP